jgi:hypothetical protein
VQTVLPHSARTIREGFVQEYRGQHIDVSPKQLKLTKHGCNIGHVAASVDCVSSRHELVSVKHAGRIIGQQRAGGVERYLEAPGSHHELLWLV